MVSIRAELDAWANEHMLTDANLRAIEDNATGIYEAAVTQLEIPLASSVKWPSDTGPSMHAGKRAAQDAVAMAPR